MLSNTAKYEILDRASKGMSHRAIAADTGLPRSTISDFLSRRTFKDFWEGIETPETEKKVLHSNAKILIYDVENSPEVGYVWGRWQQNVGEVQVIKRPYMLTWAAKWLGEDVILTDKITNYPGEVDNDYNIVKSLWELMNEADIIIAHNNNGHDEPMFNTRAMIHGFLPPAPYKRIDTLKEVKKAFKFPSNALKSLMNHLDLTRKIENEGFELWKKCMEGDIIAFNTMEEYNIGDIVSLEELYLMIRPWIRNHPNVSLYGGNSRKECVVCGSPNVMYEPDKFSYTGVSVFKTFRCSDCGKVSRGRTTIKTKEERNNILTNAL